MKRRPTVFRVVNRSPRKSSGLSENAGDRAGASLIELLVTVLLTALVVPGAWILFSGQTRVSERIRGVADALQAERAVRFILSSEVSAGVVGRDWRLIADDVVELRAFRGWGLTCWNEARGVLSVHFRGIRVPDPRKDSVLILDRWGHWSTVSLDRRVIPGEPCQGVEPHGIVEEWSVSPAVEEPLFARLFETGSYHLADGSLRYRRGAAGRQPLTPAALDPDGTGLSILGGDPPTHLDPEGQGGSGGAQLLLEVARSRRSGVPWSRLLPGNVGPPR